MKLRDKKGFTLIETLCAIILMLLVTSMIVNGLQFTTNNFEKTMSITEAQTLSETLKIAISDELRYATEIKREQNSQGENVVTYRNTNYGDVFDSFGAYISCDEEGHVGVIFDNDPDYNFNKLISDYTYTYGNKAEVKIDISNDYRIFNIDLTIKNSKDEVLKNISFEVEPIIPETLVSETDV